MDTQNFYSHIKDSDDKRPYPNEARVNIKLPFRAIFDGPSGSGKTNVLLNWIKQIGVFDKIVLLAKDLEEPLYKHLASVYKEIEKKLKIQMFLAIDNVKDLPSVDDFNPKENNLLICDDLMCESKKDLDKVVSFWIRGRKKSVSCVFISQSYYSVPKKIRENTGYIVLKKIDTPKDVKMVLKENSLGGIKADEIMQLYNYAMDQGDPHLSYFLIDTVTQKKSLRFRANLSPILPD